MNNPEVVMAVAAVISALLALGALGVSIVGLVRSVSASKDAQTAREKATSAQWKMSEHLEAIAEAQAEAVQAVARGRTTVDRVAGKLSARLMGRGRGQSFIVANVGTGPLTIEGIELDQPDVLVHDALAGVLGAELEPGEDLSMIAGLSLANRLPITVTLRWRDHDGEIRERVQKVSMS
jgi:hypothetical protein